MRRTVRLPSGRRARVLRVRGVSRAALAAAAVLIAPTGAQAAIGDIIPLGGLAACNAATGTFTGVCEPGSPIGPPGNANLGSSGLRVVVSPDGKHAYVLSQSVTDPNDGGQDETGRIGVFGRGPGGALTPSACMIFGFQAAPQSPPAQTPECVSSGNTDVDSVIAFGGSNRAVFAPDGRQLFVAGTRLAVLDRDTATGVLTGRQAIPQPTAGVSIDIAVSPDGFNVYEVTAGALSSIKSRLNVFSRALNGTLVQTQCFNFDASGGCKRLRGTTASLRHVRVSPDGSHVYVSDNRTLIPLARNADGSLAPFLDSTGFGKQVGCVSFPGAGTGCASQQVPGLEISDLELSPDGLHVFAGNTVLRRDPGTGRLSNPTAVPASVLPASGGAFEIAVSPDGQTVYLNNRTRLVAFARATGTEQLKPLAAPLGCIIVDGAGASLGCQPAVALAAPTFPSAGFAEVALDPTGANLYAASGSFAPAVRSFGRSAGPPLPPPTVGRARLVPSNVQAVAGRTARLNLVWRHPRNWRDLARLEVRLRDRGRPAGRVTFDARSDRIRLQGARGMRLIRDRSATTGSGPSGRRLTLRIVLALAPTLSARTLLVDAVAADRRGHRQIINQVGTLKIKRAR